MKLVECIYFERSGRRPAEKFIDSLNETSQRKFFAKRDLLETFGHMLPQPHAKYMGNSIFELRLRGTEGHIRVLYFFFHKNTAVFTNGFIKKRKKAPVNALNVALRSRKEFLEANEREGS